jgi:hypothetical protein
MKFTEFKNTIESKWAEKFNGKCDIKIFKCCGKCITADFYISPVMNVTWLNDMLHFNLMIDLPDNFNDDDELPEKLTLKATNNNYKIIPASTYYCYDSRRIPFRKSTGTPEKITENIGKSINKIYEMLKADISDGKIHKNHIDILLANIK